MPEKTAKTNDAAEPETTAAWVVNPTGPLRGDVSVRGSKNAVTKHLVASLLGDSPSTISNIPDIGDVDITARMLEALGWIVIRVIAEDKPKDVIARVEAALVRRGCFVEINEMQRFTRTFAA